MNIALLNTPIVFERNEVVTDSVGNHKSVWTEDFRTYATLSSNGGSEDESAGGVENKEILNFTVRYCGKTASVTTEKYRVRFGEDIYNIFSIDRMNNRKRCLKFRCRKVRR